MKSILKTWKIGSTLLEKEIVGTYSSSRLSQSSILPKRNLTGYNYEGESYYGSKLVDTKNPATYTKVEKSTAEWKYVEKLFPPVYVPQAPTDPNLKFPSGWKPPTLNKDNITLPYFIPRNKNFMIPIYLKKHPKRHDERMRTTIRHVEGNIWALEKDVGAMLQAKYPDKIIITYVNECWRQCFVRGDYVDDVRAWALEKGF